MNRMNRIFSYYFPSFHLFSSMQCMLHSSYNTTLSPTLLVLMDLRGEEGKSSMSNIIQLTAAILRLTCLVVWSSGHKIPPIIGQPAVLLSLPGTYCVIMCSSCSESSLRPCEMKKVLWFHSLVDKTMVHMKIFKQWVCWLRCAEVPAELKDHY